QMLTMADTIGLSERDVVMPEVPMFPAGAWGFPYAATLAGGAQVFTGSSSADFALHAELLASERVTAAIGASSVRARQLARPGPGRTRDSDPGGRRPRRGRGRGRHGRGRDLGEGELGGVVLFR